MAAHELRKSPTTIKGFSSLILEGSYGDVSPEVKEVALPPNFKHYPCIINSKQLMYKHYEKTQNRS